MGEFTGDVDETEAVKGCVGSGENEDDEAYGRQGEVPRLDPAIVRNRRVAHAGHHEDERPEDPADPAEDAKNEERRDDEAMRDLVRGRGECVDDVAAIELSGGDEVERGDEQAHPTGDEDGVRDEQEEGVAGVVEAFDHGLDEVDQQGGLDAVQDLPRRVFREVEADGDGEEGDDEAGDGAGGSDDDEGGAGADAGPEADDGAEASAERGCGKQVGQGGVDGEGAASAVMAELMREEDGDESEREGQPGRDGGGVSEDPVKGKNVGVGAEGRLAKVEVVHVTHADGCGREHGDDKEKDGNGKAWTAAWPGRSGGADGFRDKSGGSHKRTSLRR